MYFCSIMKLLQRTISFLKSKDFIFYIIALVALTSMFTAARLELLPGMTAGNLRVGIAAMLTDAVVLLSPYWLCPRRMKGATTAMLWLTGATLTAMMMYARFSGDLVDLRLALSAESYNSLVIRCIPLVTRASDIAAYALPPIAATAAWIVARKHNNKVTYLPRMLRGVIVAASLLLWPTMSLMLTRAYAKNYKFTTGRTCSLAEARAMRAPDNASSRIEIYAYNGPLSYLANEVANIMRDASAGLSESECAEIEDYFRLRQKVSESCATSAGRDSIFRENRKKNLIVVVVESLNARYIGTRLGADSTDVTPVLSRLLADSGTVASLNVIPQAAEGRSSDGQMIIYSGMMPPRQGVAAMLHAGNTFNALPEALGSAESIEIIGESKRVWNHRATNMAFGFNSIADYDDVAAIIPEIEEIGEDRALFGYALRHMKSMQHPFLTVLTTVKMHEPYILSDEWRQEWIDKAYSTREPDKLERDYLQTLNYFDTALGDFLAALDREDLARESVVVIVSDHDAPAKSDFRNGTGIFSPIAFIALNTGVTARLDAYPRGQADVYPTILEIIGREDRHAIGMSMFDTCVRGAFDRYGNYYGQECATSDADSLLSRSRDISALILRGDYFKSREHTVKP